MCPSTWCRAIMSAPAFHCNCGAPIPNIHLFDEPRTFRYAVGNTVVALAGFPFTRRVRDVFADLVIRTNLNDVSADVRLLCMHQTVEGAQVGPSDYTFRRGVDIIPGRQIPGDVSAVASGHIHRSQVLRHDLHGRPMPAPVIYPGAIERTSFAERYEEKHYCILEFDSTGRLAGVEFVPLPARPMATLTIALDGASPDHLDRCLREQLAALDPGAVVQIRLDGEMPVGAERIFAAAHLRDIAPATMNVTLSVSRRVERR